MELWMWFVIGGSSTFCICSLVVVMALMRLQYSRARRQPTCSHENLSIKVPQQVPDTVECCKTHEKGDERMVDVNIHDFKEIAMFHDELLQRKDPTTGEYFIQVDNLLYKCPEENGEDHMTTDEEERSTTIQQPHVVCSSEIVKMPASERKEGSKSTDVETSLHLYYQHKSRLVSEMNTNKYLFPRNGYTNQYIYAFVQPNSPTVCAPEENNSSLMQQKIHSKLQQPRQTLSGKLLKGMDHDMLSEDSFTIGQRECSDVEDGPLNEFGDGKNVFIGDYLSESSLESFTPSPEKEDLSKILDGQFSPNSKQQLAPFLKGNAFFQRVSSNYLASPKECVVNGKRDLFSKQ